jgi:hypothetical protein
VPTPEDHISPTASAESVDVLLRKLLRVRVPTDWSYRGEMTFLCDEHRLNGDNESTIGILNGQGRGTLVIPEIVGILESIVDGTLSFAYDGRTVTAKGALSLDVRSSSSESGSHTRFKFDAYEISTILPDVAVAFTRETTLGMYLGARAAIGMATEFATNLFSRHARVAGYSTEGSSLPVDALQVVYEGGPLEAEQRVSVRDVLRFLSGQRGCSTFVEYFDQKLGSLGFVYKNDGPTTLHHVRAPVNLHFIIGRQEVKLLEHEFSVMIEAMRSIRESSHLAISATIHHYNDGSMNEYVVSKLRDMSVALEALGVTLLGRQARLLPIISDDVFTERIALVLDAFDQAFLDIESTEVSKRERLRLKLVNLNLSSPRDELFSVLESLNIGLSDKEKSWIRKMRNGILHSGFHGDDSEHDVFQVNIQAADLFANVYARAMLRKLGFSGRYRDAVSGSETLQLDVAPDYPLLSE